MNDKNSDSDDTIIHIEKLTPPKNLLKMMSPEEVTENIEKNAYRTSIDKPMATFKDNPFFKGILYAYENHCPLVLSPDIIWLLIMQAFSRFVTNDAEKLRHLFVNFEGKKTLTVVRNSSPESTTNKMWMDIFAEFNTQIGENIGPDLLNNITPNFTTTTPLSLSTCQLTIMHTFKDYFEYKVMMIGCGIPYVRLMGTVEDWVKIKEKLNALSKYGFSWFIDSIKQPIDEFIEAKKGNADIEFWNRMVRLKTRGAYNISVYDGWILNFFPYNHKNQRIYSLIFNKTIESDQKIASEILEVPFKLEYCPHIFGQKIKYDGIIKTGFVGISQDPKNYEIMPEMGWVINITKK